MLLGPTSLEKTALNLERVRVLVEDVECRPCYLRECPIDHRCLVRIAPERAVEAALPFFGDTVRRGAGRCVTDLSIVIVTWNGRELLLDCLASIEREVRSRADAGRIETETLVVDQASTDGSAAAVRESFPWAEVIELSDNVGFAAGNNVGLRRAKGRHCVLLNNDTVVLRDGLETCVRYLDAHPDVGVVGPQLLNPDGQQAELDPRDAELRDARSCPTGLLERIAPWRFPSKRFDHAGPGDGRGGARRVPRRAPRGARRRRPDARGVLLLPRGDRLVPAHPARGLEGRAPARTRAWSTCTARRPSAACRRRRASSTTARSTRSSARTAARPRSRRLVAIRVLKGFFYAATGWIPGLVSSRARHRWIQNLRVLAWHLRGRPEREGSSGSCGPAKSHERSARP